MSRMSILSSMNHIKAILLLLSRSNFASSAMLLGWTLSLRSSSLEE